MNYRVEYAPGAEDDLAEIHETIASAASPEIALRFTFELTELCEGLANFPFRGTIRNHRRPGMRVIGFRRRVSVAFEIHGDVVRILGFLYAGREIHLP